MTVSLPSSAIPALRSIGIMAHSSKHAAIEVARIAEAYLSARGILVLLQEYMAEALGLSGLAVSDLEVASADAVLVLGGDGTILATSRACAPLGTPMLPIHLGRFGFLTEVAPERLTPALDALLAGDYRIDERLMLLVQPVHENDLPDQVCACALNEVVIANGPLSRVLHLGMSVDGSYVTSYAADGILIATPTGSTAYSLSAGGPLVHPSLQTILITPICPHTLTARALLIPPDSEVTLVVEDDPQDVVRVTIDGQIGFPLFPGDELRVRRAPHCAKILTVGGATFYEKLQTKLRWGERMVY